MDRARIREIASRVLAGLNRIFHDPKLRDLRERDRDHLRALIVDADAVVRQLDESGDPDTFEGVHPPTLHDDAQAAVVGVTEAIARGAGRFAFATIGGRPTLFAGAHRAVRVPNGFIVSLGLSRDHLIEIRDAATTLLAAG